MMSTSSIDPQVGLAVRSGRLTNPYLELRAQVRPLGSSGECAPSLQLALAPKATADEALEMALEVRQNDISRLA